jgi:hypothetical protein
LVALLCFLSLMFPVISATDDLHPIAPAVEDASKRTYKTVKSPTRLNRVSSPAIVLSAPMISPPLCVAEGSWSAAVPSIQAGRMSFALLRAPPATNA